MSTGKEILTSVLGREPTIEEMSKLFDLRESFGLADNDPMWAILVAFGHFEILYAQIPEKIAMANKMLIAEHKLAIELQASATTKSVEKTLIAKVTETANELAQRALHVNENLLATRLKREFAMATSLAVLIAVIALGSVGWLGYTLGVKSNTDKGWVSSNEGKAAKRLAELNDLSGMLNCSEKRWSHTDKTCSGDWKFR